MIFLSLPFSSGAQDQKQEIVLLGRKKAPGQVLLQKVKYSKYSDNIPLQKVRYSKYSDNLQICCTHQTTKISPLANNENIESLFCPDRIMTSCSMQPLTTRRTSNTSTALWRFVQSGFIQTSFDQVFIKTCFMWLLTPQSSDKQMMVTNVQTGHGITISGPKYG